MFAASKANFFVFLQVCDRFVQFVVMNSSF